MTNEPEQNDSQSQDDWEIYLQAFLDESDEDLESLVQALLRLENDPHDAEPLNEAFRLLHTHKGSAGLMGFEGISELAHELENRFDQFRSGQATLDRARITVLLRCVDFLRTFNAGLRAGQSPAQDASHVLRQLQDVEQLFDTAGPEVDHSGATMVAALPSLQGGYRVRVEFEDGLQLADMKARLIVARLSNVGEIIATDPPVDDMQSFDDLSQFVLIVLTDHDRAEVQKIAHVDGVKSVQIEGGEPAKGAGQAQEPQPAEPEPPLLLEESKEPFIHFESGEDAADSPQPSAEAAMEPVASVAAAPTAPQPSESSKPASASAGDPDSETSDAPSEAGSPAATSPVPTSPESQTDRAAVAETVRVGIDRLDKLLNLTGELVVTKARFVQITREMHSVFRANGMSNRSGDLGERCRVGLNKIKEVLAARVGHGNGWHALLNELQEDLEVVEEQFTAWEEGRRHFTRIAETVDQLSRVSGNLQQSVLDTRMVPVAPLFNRFRRVIRDLAGERNKQVQLVIRGEKTELDKRMIDELGDPLLHLVRNSLDHGLELPEQRRRLGKPETGTIVLEASHRGNNVFITISDDGAGLSIDRIRQRVLDRGLASETALAELSEQQVIQHIWQPGFSTAEQITEISGRGVGMDVVKNRITELNGSIEVETTAREGASFQLRLPLTLAIIRCLLVRFRAGFFSVPIDDVREIVSVALDRIHSVHGSETIDVRGEFIPLIRMDRVFYWHDVDYHTARSGRILDSQSSTDLVNVVILHSAGRTIGLGVDALLGSADIVIKSLSDNFVNIQGLSGASIMGDGTVCLMLYPSEVIKMATQR